MKNAVVTKIAITQENQTMLASRNHRIAVLTGLMVCVLAAGILAGCSSETKTPGAQGGKKVAAILMQEDQFFRLNEFGMKDAAQKAGVELVSGNATGKPDEEIKLIDNYVEQKVDAILISPMSAASATPALKRAFDKGIKIVTYNNSIDAEFPSANIESSQNDLGAATGKAAAEYIKSKLNGKAKIAILAFGAQVPEQSKARVDGFKSAFKDMPGVEFVAQQDDAALAEKAVTKVEAILTATPELNIIWAANEGGTVGAVTAVKGAGKAGKVAVFGTDMSEQLADFLLAGDGVLQAVTAQKPFDMGSMALNTAVKVIKGEPVEKKVSMPGVLYTREKPEEVKDYKLNLQELAK